MSTSIFRANDNAIYGDYIVTVDNEVLLCAYFDRVKTKVRSCGCAFGSRQVEFGWYKYQTKESRFHTVYKPVRLGRDRFIYGFTRNGAIGSRFLITTEEYLYDDLFNYLMNKYHLPLLKEWIPYLLEEGIMSWGLKLPHVRIETTDDDRAICLHDEQIPLKKLLVIDFGAFSEEALKSLVSKGLSRKRICIAGEPQGRLMFHSFDEYLQRYGKTIVENLEKELNPLMPLKGTVDSAAFYHKRLFPQQAACVNGIVAMRKKGIRRGLLVQGMGVGKTIQGAGICDAYANEMWLENHPGKTLADVYKSNEVTYRNIVMMPAHLVEKWKTEILSEIPGSRVVVIHDLSVLTALREAGRKRTGRDWYLVSKDFCKLGSQYSPIPTDCGNKYLVMRYCLDCKEELGTMVPIRKLGVKASCPCCGGQRFGKRYMVEYGKKWGVICPECGELLHKSCVDEDMECTESIPLRPRDFASRNRKNAVCGFCGAQLWGVDVKPVMGGSPEHLPSKPAWRKISHWRNCARKTRVTAFVLRGKEWDYTSNTFCDGITEVEKEYGPRKTAPSLFIRKYLKGYFDFCLLDECQSYENGGTAQFNAAQALVKVSDAALGLTGTLTNGMADSLFYLLYMLCPEKMRKAGYGYGDAMRFAEKYGSIESVYEVEESEGSYNASSRGRQIQSPRVKPGLNPLLVSDFLLEMAVFLDLSDLSRYLPILKETVVLVRADPELESDYMRVMNILSKSTRTKEGRGMMTQMVNFGLSYMDKPFGRKPIMSTVFDDCMIASVPEHPEYLERLLPKEEKLVEIIKGELEEDRSCFVYCSYTGEAETNITGRLKEVIEKHCNLKGQVYVLTSTNPSPIKREQFLHEKAAEGYRVIICNPRCVETGLDLCFWFKGKWYNYPTLIFYQMSTALSVVWQASRRAYRLIQTEECRNYYLGYENTLQASILQLMAEKQVAASAIQGKFSVEGLSSLAKGVDPRVKLAQMLSDGDVSSRETLENMFDVLNKDVDNLEKDTYSGWIQPKTYYELMGIEEVPDNSPKEITLLDVLAEIENVKVEETQAAKKQNGFEAWKNADFFEEISIFNLEQFCVIANDNDICEVPKPRTKSRDLDGQMTLFGFIA